MDEFFRCPKAVQHDPAIDEWLRMQVPDLGVIAHEWFELMRACGKTSAKR